jgi:ribosomal protein L28
MAYICDNCGKAIAYGRSQRHRRGIAGKRWAKRTQKTLRLFKPNLQKVSVLVSGKKTTMRLCTKCVKKFKKEGKTYSVSKAALG